MWVADGGVLMGATGVALVLPTPTLAGCAGGISAMLFTWIRYGKPDLSMTCNGILAGLVGITAGPDLVGGIGALGVGVVGGGPESPPRRHSASFQSASNATRAIRASVTMITARVDTGRRGTRTRRSLDEPGVTGPVR